MKFKKKIFTASAIALTIFTLTAQSALAHVAVTPAEVVTASRQDFSVGVPNEKDIPTTSVRLVLAEGLSSVTPYVKPGWDIEMKTSGEGEDANITEIIWSGGKISQGLRDVFVFRAMTPADETTLVWKAYQTYSDGTVVSWDQEESEDGHDEAEDETKGPQSETKVVKALSTDHVSEKESPQLLNWVAYGALLIAAVSLALNFRTLLPKK